MTKAQTTEAADRAASLVAPEAGETAAPKTAPRHPRSMRAVTIVVAVLATAAVFAAVVLLDPLIVGGLLLVVCGLYVFRRRVFNWTSMLFLLTAVVLFIPIRRYALPIPVGFALEPYRVVIAVLIAAVAIRFFLLGTARWQPVVWGWPIAIFMWTSLASLMFNSVSLTETGLITGGFSNIFTFAFLLSLVVLVRQMLSSERVTLLLLNFIVFGGALIGLLAFFERVSRRNVFLELNTFLPLTLLRDDAESVRAGGARAFGSAQHPIALAVLFCLIIPLAIYLMKFSPRPRFGFTRILVYSGAIGLMMIGLLSAVSRTGIVSIGVMFVFVLVLRPRLAGRLALVGLPILILVGLIFPALFESTVLLLFDVQGLVASQQVAVGLPGQGRLADLPEAFAEFSKAPLAGTGLGSRVVTGEYANSQILDNQWLGSLLDTGSLGILGLIALLVWPIVTMVRFVFRKDVPESRTFLVLAIAASTVGYTTAMFFYDAFAFMQTLLVLSTLLAIAAWAMTHGSEEWAKTEQVPAIAVVKNPLLR